MKIAVIDDEPKLIELAKHTILDYSKKKNLAIEVDGFTSGEDFLDAYMPESYDIIFMDVFMPTLSGIETVLRLHKIDMNVPVIFLTTSETHMKEALSCHAFDYLVKPATRVDFFRVLDDCINFLGDSISDSSKYIEFKANTVTIKLSSSQIVSVLSSGHSVSIYTKDKNEFTTRENFSTITEWLSDCKNFLIINRGILLNMDYITDINDGVCTLEDGSSYSVKVRGYKEVLQTYWDYKQSKA